MTAEAAAHLEEAGVAVKPYAALLGDVRALAAAGTRIWADPAKVLPGRHEGCCDLLESMVHACSPPPCTLEIPSPAPAISNNAFF